jgi:Transglycosylase SLT domain
MAAALATAGPAAGSLSGLGSASAQAQVAHVTAITHNTAQEAAAASAARAARQTARKMLGHFGWGGRQFSPLVKLWNRESGWNKYAQNPSSGAYGIPQAVPGSKMASAGKNWRSNATTQIRWGLRYIKGRYGYPRRAWQHELAYGWY